VPLLAGCGIDAAGIGLAAGRHRPLGVERHLGVADEIGGKAALGEQNAERDDGQAEQGSADYCQVSISKPGGAAR
jgi:hypothetical protein